MIALVARDAGGAEILSSHARRHKLDARYATADPTRQCYAAAMAQLTRFLGKKCPDSSAYQPNLLSCLQRELHDHPAYSALQEASHPLATVHRPAILAPRTPCPI